MIVKDENLLVTLFVLSLSSDILNNILLTILKTNFGITEIIKGIVLLLLLFLVKNKYVIIGFIFLLSLFFIRESIILQTYDRFTFRMDVVVALRFFLLYLALGVLYQFRNSEVIDKLVKLFYIFVIVQSISIWLGFLFHIDFFKAYVDRNGYKGLIFGVNDAAFFMTLSFTYAFYLFITKKKYIFFVLVLSASLILGLGSRGTLLGIIVVFYLMWFFHAYHGSKLEKLLFFILNFCFFAFLYFYVLPRIDYLLEIFMEQSVRVFEGTGSFLTALFSYRNIYMIDYFESIRGVFTFLFGIQFPYVRTMIESDIFDFLYRFGLIGLVFFYGIIFSFSFNKNKNYFKKILLIIIILMGFLMGHVLLSSSNALWVSLFIIYYSYTKLKVS